MVRVKWRFECRYYLVTCFMMVDYNIYVWDVRRFFVSVVMFEEYRDVIIGIVWRYSYDFFFLFFGFKDSTLC